MRRLSGEFLSRLTHALQSCNAEPGTPEAVLALLQPLCEGGNVFVELPATPAAAGVLPPGARALPAAALERLNTMLPWCTLAGSVGGAVQGSQWSPGKPPPGRLVNPVQAVRPVAGRASLAGQRVLDIGCFEGLQSIGFAAQGADVWAIDARIENVAKCLVRAWLAGLERQVSVQLVDLERGPLAEQLAGRGMPERFELVHHSQVLNHLSDPVTHLHEVAGLCGGRLYLNTHVETCADAQADATIELDGQAYAVCRHREPTAGWEPFAGTTAQSNWLTRESLLRLLAHLGFDEIEVQLAQDGPNGHRLALMATRAPVAAAAPAPRPPRPAVFRKVLVAGLGRSGTSAVASLLKACGFYMGDDLDPVLHESTGLRALLKQRRQPEIVATLNGWLAAHEHVAWKDPKLHSEGAAWIETLDDDWLVFAVFRDPVAVAQRRALADGMSFAAAFELTLASEARLRQFVQRCSRQVVPVSYERLMASPHQAIAELLAHLDLAGLPVPSVEAIWAYMQERRLQYRREQTRAMPVPGAEEGENT